MVPSSIARKFDFLQERAQRQPIRETSMDSVGADGGKKTDINHLKEFYLKRLTKTDQSASRFGPKDLADPAQQQVGRPTFKAFAPKDIEDLEVMCNNCYNLIKSSEAGSCTGDPRVCPIACRNNGSDNLSGKSTGPVGPVAVIDLKLKKLRAALETRLLDSSSKVNVMRHLTQLRYHIDTASKWTAGCSEIGALSDHTVQQVKQLTATSRVLAPAVYIFSKRIENIVVQKERELRRSLLQTSSTKASSGGQYGAVSELGPRMEEDSMADVTSIVSELDSDCGTQYAETLVTQDGQSADVGNVQDANDYLNLKNEDEQRRWFYAQTLTVKLSVSNKTKARKTLISDLYAKVREQEVPIERWVEWIREQLTPGDDDSGGSTEQPPHPHTQTAAATAAAAAVASPKLGNRIVGIPVTQSAAQKFQGDLDRTVPVQSSTVPHVSSRPGGPRLEGVSGTGAQALRVVRHADNLPRTMGSTGYPVRSNAGNLNVYTHRV